MDTHTAGGYDSAEALRRLCGLGAEARQRTDQRIAESQARIEAAIRQAEAAQRQVERVRLLIDKLRAQQRHRATLRSRGSDQSHDAARRARADG